MQCFVLGTGGMMPLPRRRLSSVVVRPSSRMVQFDCGEGVQVGFKELKIGIKPLDVIAITHLHADHVLGLPGVLMFRAQCDDPGPIILLGPKGLKRFVKNVLADLACFINFPIEIREWSRDADPIAYSDEEFAIKWLPLNHGVTCLGYRLEEHQRPGKFDPEKARSLNIPVGPLWGKLQNGISVDLEDGTTISPDQVVGPSRRGRSVAYCTDTSPCENIETLCKNSDVAFIESMFMPEHEDEARKKLHLTLEQALKTTQKAGVAKTVVIHLSPRYGPQEIKHMKVIAQSINPNSVIGRDLTTIEIPLPN